MRSDTAAGIHDVQLPALAAAIRRDQGVDDLAGAASLAQQFYAVDAVIRIDQRLRRDAADVGGDMRHACADREEFRRDCDAELAGGIVSGDDRPSHFSSFKAI